MFEAREQHTRNLDATDYLGMEQFGFTPGPSSVAVAFMKCEDGRCDYMSEGHVPRSSLLEQAVGWGGAARIPHQVI